MWLKTFIRFFIFFGPLSLMAQSPTLVMPEIHWNHISNMAYSRDGQIFLTANSGIKIWEAQTGRLIRNIHNNITYFSGDPVGLSTDGSTIISGGEETNVLLFSSANGKLIKTLTPRPSEKYTEFHHVELSADGKFALAVLGDQLASDTSQLDVRTEFWEVATGKRVDIVIPAWASFTRDNKYLLARDQKSAYLIDFQSGKKIKTFRATYPIVAIASDPENRFIVAALARKLGSKKKRFALAKWDVLTGKRVFQKPVGPIIEERSLSEVSISTDASRLTVVEHEQFDYSLYDKELDIYQYHTSDGSKFRESQVQGLEPMGVWGILTPDHDTYSYVHRVFWASLDYDVTAKAVRAVDVRSGETRFDYGVAIQDPNFAQCYEYNFQPFVTAKKKLFSFDCLINSVIRQVYFHPETKKSIQGFDLTIGYGYYNWDFDVKYISSDEAHYFDLETASLYSFKEKEALWSIKEDTDTDEPLTAARPAFGENGALLVWGYKNSLSIYDKAGNLVRRIPDFPLTRPQEDGLLYFSEAEQKIYLTINRTDSLQFLDLENPTRFQKGPNSLIPAILRPSRDTLLSVACDGSGIIGLYHKDIRVANFLQTGPKDWVITTPSGLFDGTDKGINTLHFIKGMEVIELESLRERYWVPNLLQKLLAGKLPKEIRDVSGFSFGSIYPSIKAKIENNTLLVEIKERSGGMGDLNLYINGAIVNRDINKNKQKSLSVNLKDNKYAKHYYSKQANTIVLQAFNKEGWFKSRPIKLSYQPDFPIQRDHKKAHLYAVIVGTSDYKADEMDLAFAGKDAVSIYQAMQIAGKALFQDRVDIHLFTTDQQADAQSPTKDQIFKTLSAIADKAEPIDLVLLYFAGHGTTYGEAEKSKFYYLTQAMTSFRLSDSEIRDQATISQEEITSWLSSVAAKKKVLVLDACNSGQFIDNISQRSFSESQIRALNRMKGRTGMYILASSAADMASYEASRFGQGLLTYSLLRGMQILSMKHENHEVDILELLSYAENQVQVLAEEIGVEQAPKMHNQEGLSSFPIGIVKDPATIPAAAVKPILIQPLLVKEGELEDPLDLISSMENYIQKQVRRGGPFTFRSVRKNNQGYSIRGTYRLSEERIIAKVYLRKGLEKITTEDLVVEGRKDEIKQLIELIFERIEPYIK